MTRLNFTFQEASPLITYSGWTEGSPENDTLASSYNGSFRVTQTAGATATFSFTGTAVSLFGAARPNHGNYSVQIDQQPLFTAVGGGDNLFKKSLWHSDDLGYTSHTVTLTNVPTTPGPFLDLDFVSIEREIGQDGDTIFQTTIDDTSPAVKYQGSWQQTTDVSTAFQGTLRTTTAANSQALVTFQGCCIELYGQYANAPYTVVVDNLPPTTMQGMNVDLSANFFHPQTLLYLVDGLSETGNHTVKLTNSVSDVNRPFSFDYALVSSTHNISSTVTTAPGFSGNATGALGSTQDSTPVGAIVGGVVGALFVVLVILLAFLFMRRRRRRRAQPAFPLDLIDEEPKPYMLPGQPELEDGSYSQDVSYTRTLPPLPGGAGQPQSSKALSQMDFYPRNDYPSSEGLIGPQGRSEASGSSSYGRASSTATSTTRSGTSATRSGTTSSRSASTSRRDRRDTKSRFSALQEAGEGSGAAPAVQEQDAGAVLEPEEEPVARTLPPAYNPEWDQSRS